MEEKAEAVERKIWRTDTAERRVFGCLSTEKESADAGRDVLDVDTNDEPSTADCQLRGRSRALADAPERRDKAEL